MVINTCSRRRPIMCFRTPNGPSYEDIEPMQVDPMPPSSEPLRDMERALSELSDHMVDNPTHDPHVYFSETDPHPAHLDRLCAHLWSWQTETPGLDPNEFDVEEEQRVLLMILDLRYKLDQNLLRPPVLVPLLDRWLTYAIDLAIWHELRYEPNL